MPKQVLQVTNFAGGLNAYSDARDIEDNQFVQNWNAVVDKNGIIRVSGMAEDSITTEYFDNTNFQKGYGLFQFTADYSLSGIDGDFSTGIKTGTLSAYTSGTPSVALEAGVAAQATDYYKDWIIYIYSGPGNGESRKITTSTDASPPVLTISATASLTTASKYIIYRWTPSSDFLGDGTNNYNYIEYQTEYSLVSKSGNVSTNTSNPLGYVDYEPKLSLIPGVEYTASFDCKASTKYYNAVSNGHEDGNATNNYADKVPWVELYSTTVADTKGSIKTLNASASGVLVFVSSESNVTGNWEASRTNEAVIPTSTSGQGEGALFNVITDGSGNHTVRLIPDRTGQGYKASDTLILTDPGDTTETITLTVATINTTGLSLVSTGIEGSGYAWLKGIDGDGTASGYITKQDSNYIDNGDFRTTITTEWGLVNHDDGTAHALTAAIGSTDESYDGLASSLKLTTTIKGINGPGDGWISQTVTLDELTPYALNFIYSAKSPNGRAQVRVLDQSGNELFYKSLQTTCGLVPPVYRWANQITDNALNNNFSYIQFKTPKSITSASTVACKIQFRPEVNNIDANYFFLHGVTLHKNHFDLSNMSFNNPQTNNPFTGNIAGYSRYSVKFTVPDNYSSVSDWVFRIHAGKYGWIDNNDLVGGSENSQSQQVNIKNIEINGTFETKESVTLLMDNSQVDSSISAYTSSSLSWKKNFLNFTGTNVKPVYSYINGMLKVSDSNFLNNNENKLVYYSTRRIHNTDVFPRWVKRENSIISPPLLSVSQNDEDNTSDAIFDCNKYFNDYFTNPSGGGHTLRENESRSGEGWTGTSVDSGATNWPLNSFGGISFTDKNPSGVINPTGLVTRYWASQFLKTKPMQGRTWIDGYSILSEISGLQHLFNPATEFYQDTFLRDPILGMSDQAYLDKYFFGSMNKELYISSQGHKSNYYDASVVDYLSFKGLVNRGISPPDSGEVTNDMPQKNMRNPIDLVIEPSAFSDMANFKEIQDIETPLGNIKYIDIKFKAEYVMWSGPFSSWDYLVPPVFDFSAGILDSIFEGSDLKIKQINVEEMDFENNSSILSVIGDLSRDYNSFPNGMGSIWNVGTGNAPGCLGFTDRYDSLDKLKSLNIDRGHPTEHAPTHGLNYDGTNFKITMTIEDRIEFPIDGIQIDASSDILLIKLKEHIYHAGMMSGDGDGGLGIHAGWGSQDTWYNDAYWEYASYGYQRYPLGLGWANGTVEMNPIQGEHTSFHSRYIIENFEIGFWNKDVETAIELEGRSVGINFHWDSTNSEGVGWTDRIFEIASTSVNFFGEESGLSLSAATLGKNSAGASFIQSGEAPSIRFKMKESYLNDIFISKTKIYMRDSESEIWYLQCYIDHKKRTFHSTTSFESSNASTANLLGEIEWFLSRDNFKNFNEVNSYESETMVSQDDAVSNNKLTARYKTATIANNRMYVGNVMQDGIIHGDRMLKSPIGKYNILPASNFIDVAINDGDEITALEYYKDKLLQFKQRKVFVINISGDYEFLEDTFDNVGVVHQASVAKTPHGIVWANKTGCYMYDGSKMTNLIDGRIPSTSEYAGITNNYWLASNFDGDCVVGYMQSRDTLLVRWQADTNAAAVSSPEAITYHFPTKSWCFNTRGISGNIVESNVGALSNMITDTDGELLYYRFQSGSVYNSIKKWENSPSAIGSVGSSSGSSKVFQFSTKDFTFGNIVNRKKLYKVYITYKVGTDGTDSGITVEGAVNGSGDFTDIDFSTSSTFTGGGNCYDSSTLNETDAKWKIAELKFAVTGDVNNIYSFQLKLSGSAVPADFEINDISIVFRTKNTK